MLRDEMTIIMMNGLRVPLTRDKLARLLFHWTTLSIWLLLDILALVSNLFPPLNKIAGWQALGSMILSNFIGLLTGMLCVVLQAWLMKGRAYATLAIVPAALIGTWVVLVLTRSFGADVEKSFLGLATLFAFIYCFAEIFSAVLVHVLVPRISGSLSLPPAPTAPQQAAPEHAASSEVTAPKALGMIQFANRAVAAETILRIGAQGNYVQIVTETDSFLEVGPLKAVVGRLPEGMGAIVHRSYWVAWRDVARVRLDGRSAILELRSGELIPVSRSKRGEVPADLKRSQ